MNEPMKNNRRNRVMKPLASGWRKDTHFSGELHRYNDSRFSGHIRIRQPQNPKYTNCSVEIVLSDRKQRKFLPTVDYKVEVNSDDELQQAVEDAKKKAEEIMSSVSNLSEGVAEYDYQERDTHIPAPFDKYYEIGMLNDGSIPEEDIPDAFGNYGGMTLLAVVYAKEQYEDALGDNCLDYCYLVEDGSKFALVTTAGQRVYYVDIAEVERCVNKDVDEDFDVREPSSVDYGNAISNYYRELTNTIEKYGIRKYGRKRAIEYDGVVNGYKFYFVHANTGTGHYAKELYINGREVDLYQSKDSERSFSTLNEMNYFGILSLVKMLETDNLGGIVYKDELDDYDDFLTESTEMSDSQRLALQELDSCLEYGELNAEKHALAYQIQWDINFEDVLLFINGIDIPLQDIKHVEYGDCSSEYDGCYSVTLHNGTTKQYGWHDWDATASLTCIDCNESLTESDDGWDKPFSWTQVYKKAGFMISDNYNGTFHLEQTSPKQKHLGNYKTLEAAKAAGDAEITKRNTKNANKPVQFGVHSFTTDSIIFRGTEEECADYINKNGLESEAEIYMMTADDSHYLEESATRRFKNGDRVYVTVANRQGHVTKMVSDDVVEVEFDANGTYPERIDRFYADEVELIDMNPDLAEDVNEQCWAVSAKDTITGNDLYEELNRAHSLDEGTSEEETTKTTEEIKHEITRSIWELIEEHAYPNGCSDTDAFYSALRELSKKYSDHKRLFYSIRSRILRKEAWYD